jgi:nucleotide-binding universal stress UspA family protein
MRIGAVDQEWMVGLCERPHCRGALQVGKWLGSQGNGAWGVRGVHIVSANERDDDEPAGRPPLRALENIAELVTEANAAGSMEGIEFLDADSPEDGLREIAETDGVRGIVIGRSARADENALVRLGRTARRLLRDCAAPVVVAGPEVDIRDLESGPVLVGVGLTERCAHATAWARWLASSLHRPLHAVHVVGVPDVPGVEGNGRSLVDHRVIDALETGAENLRAWQEDYGFEDVWGEAILGVSPARRLLAHALAIGACAIVCGSRHLGLAQRLFSNSVSTELAYESRWPVAVVPPPPDVAPQRVSVML